MNNNPEKEVSRLQEELEQKNQEYELALKKHDEDREALLNILDDLQKSHDRIEQIKKEWSNAFDAVSDPILIHDNQFRIVRANLAYANASGMPIKEIVGKHYWEVFPKRDGPLPSSARITEIPEGETEDIITLEDGDTYISRSYAINDEHGNYLHSVHIFDDITGEIQAKKELEESEEKFRSVLTAAQDAVIMLDDKGNILYWNPAAERILGYTSKEALGQNAHLLLAPSAYHDDYYRGWKEFYDTGGGPVVGKVSELEAICKDGKEIPIELSISSFRLRGRYYAVGIVRDITERKHAEEKLENSEHLRRSLLNTLTQRVFYKDMDSVYIACNTAFARNFNIDIDDISGKTDFDIFPKELAERYCLDDKEVMQTGETKEIEEPYFKDGVECWSHTVKTPMRDATGTITGVLGIFWDITEHRRAEQALKRSEANLAEAQKIAHLGSWEYDHTTGVIHWSDEVYRIFELEPGEFDGKYETFLSFVHPEDRELVNTTYSNHINNKSPYDIVHRLILEDNRVKYVNERCETTCNDSNPVISIGTVQDITEQKQKDIALHRINRALKALSSGNTVLVRAKNENDLLQEMCRVVTQVGGYRMAWVGYAMDGISKNVKPVARSGLDNGYLDIARISWADNVRGRGPTGLAIRTGKVQLIRDAMNDERYATWSAEAVKRGYASVIALPLLDDDNKAFGALTIDSNEPDAFDSDEIGLLQELAGDLSYGIIHIRTRAERANTDKKLRQTLVETIEAIAMTVEKRDPYTAGHQRNVAKLCVAIGQEIGMEEDRLEGLRLGATIHDIGKIYIPAEILNRPGKLTPSEFEIIKSHPLVGYDIIKDVSFPWPVADMVLQHHERVDGSGYPHGLKGDDIALEAKILAVADVVDAMSAHRPYRPARGVEQALEELEKNKGRTYDKKIVEACMRVFHEHEFSFQQ